MQRQQPRLRLRTLEQHAPGRGMRPRWINQRNRARTKNVFETEASASRGRPDLSYFSTRTLNDLKAQITGSKVRIGESILNRTVMFTPPLNGKKSLLEKQRNPAPRLPPRPRPQQWATVEPQRAAADKPQPTRRRSRQYDSLGTSGWDQIGYDDEEDDDDDVGGGGGEDVSSGPTNADGLDASHSGRSGSGEEAFPRIRTRERAHTARPQRGRAPINRERGSSKQRHHKCRRARSLDLTACRKVHRVPAPRPTEITAAVPLRKPAHSLHYFGAQYAQRVAGAHNRVVESIVALNERRAAEAEQQRKAKQQKLERFYHKVREEGLEEYDNLDSSSTDSEFEEYLRSGSKYSSRHPLAARMQEKVARRRERQRQRLKQGLERRMEVKSLALERGENVWNT